MKGAGSAIRSNIDVAVAELVDPVVEVAEGLLGSLEVESGRLNFKWGQVGTVSGIESE